MSQAHRYCIVFFVLWLSALAGAAAVNYGVNPYGFYRPADRDIFPRKPAMTQFEKLGKFAVIQKQKPDTVIIGSSRADYGLDPNHPALGDNAYNAALKGMTIAHLPEAVNHVISNEAKRVILAVDFFMFNRHMVSGHDMNAIGDWHTVLMFSTFRSSLKTIFRQHDTRRPTITAKGLHTTEHLHHLVRQRGIDGAFDNQHILLLSRMYFPAPAHEYDIGKNWDHFENSLRLLRQNDVETVIIINPVHADTLVLIHNAGLWDIYKEWQTRLHRLAHHYRFEYRDYTGINDVTVSHDLFWDNSHYKIVVGDMILDGKSLPYNIPIIKTERDIMRYECQNPHIVTAIRDRIVAAGFENRLIPRHSCVSY